MPFVKPSLEQELTEVISQGIEFSLDPQVIIDWIVANFDAEDIYPAEHLAAWAERAGYVLGHDSDADEQRVRY